MTVSNWRAPASSNTALATDIDQFLGTHAVTYLYQGASQQTGAASTTGTLNTNTGAATQWIAQPFTTGGSQTTLTRVELRFTIQGTGADLTIDLQTNNAGNPAGTLVSASTTLIFPLDFLPGSVATVSFPLNATGLSTSTKYHIVVHGTASTTNYAKLDDGTTVTNAALTSANGSSWATAGKSLVFTTYAGVNGNLIHTWEDSGARWSGLEYANTGTTAAPPSKIREYTTATVATVGRSLRTMTLTSGALTSIA